MENKAIELATERVRRLENGEDLLSAGGFNEAIVKARMDFEVIGRLDFFF